MVAPAIAGHFADSQKTTVHAATTLENCKPTGETATECKIVGDSCPSGYTKSEETCKKSTTAQAANESIVKTATFLVQLQKILGRIIWPVLIMIGGLMDNSLLFGNGMEERLREIWIPIRNIVNILFVIALVGIALYNVLGIGDENSNYSIKAILPKIIIGIIVVNFSFLGIKVFLDGINVLTTAIFALPNQIGAATVLNPDDPNDKDKIDKMCRSMEGLSASETIDKEKFEKDNETKVLRRIAGSNEFKVFFDAEINIAKLTAQEILWLAAENLDESQQKDFSARYDENMKGMLCGVYTDTKGVTKMKLAPQGEIFMKKWNNRSAPLAMAVGLGNIVFYEEIDPGSLASMEKIFINTVLSLLLYLIFAASFIALFVVLLGRLVVMWLAIALSPILLLGIAVPAVKEKLSGFGEITNTFVQNAIAPLGIALSLSVGWIMLKALQGLNSLSDGGSISFSATQGIPVVGLTTLQDLLVGVGTIAVIWLGVFAAASKSIAAPVTDMIKNGLGTAGKWIGTLPFKHAPIFHIDLPGVTGDEKYTGSQVWEAVRGLASEKKPYKLRDLLTNRKTVSSRDFADKSKIKTSAHVLSWLKNADEQNMSAKDLQSGMLTLKKNRKDLYNNVKKEYKDLGEKIDDVIEKKGKKLKTAGSALLKHYRVRNFRAPATTTTAATTTTSTSTTTTVTHNIQIRLLKEGKVTSSGEIKDAINKLSPGTTPAILKRQIGDEPYEKVLAVYGGDEKKLKEALPK